MGKLAFVFSGQGDQYPGMGRDLYEKYPEAARIFQICEQIRPGTVAQCFSGTAEELQETGNTQPCLFAMEQAAAAVLQERGIVPDAVAGFSLGEVSAAAAAGYFDLETAFRLVMERGRQMQAEAEKQNTAMAAVLKLSAEKVTEISGTYANIYPVNFNCPGQVSVCGPAEEMHAFAAAVKAAGGRILPLKVKGAFHSPFMHNAAEAFAETLNHVTVNTPEITLYSNVTAKPYGEHPKTLLAKQIENPVQWEKLIRQMIADGIDTFLEIGPGHTLTNMIKRIDPQVTALSVTEYLKEVSVC